ncbi:MAG: UDP-N-acetyl-D-mannosamine dehydrogenase [Piscinibacter sp.]|uniref:UDP-N-acetyl-D-mannosamine dehydrogenase n=1 Tax=Piscinibacter sp. TaxID=1903157 RepID=UPI002590479F|nr:UDP-N-acetyl-D-mannosamine dehydrogenase [Piscinibacter sp.]MCW5666904.1 UDP-N-acetyl-D-mannosamine dehydrogenase [Piscinibacter sp.]
MNPTETFATVSMIGLGYIGLPTAAMFAARRTKVIGVDINAQAVETINQGRIHIVEPELDMIVHSAVTEGFLRATTRPEPADAFLIAVPTPFQGDHEPDVSFVKSAAESIAPVLRKGNLVVLESTSPVGTTEQMVQWLAAARPDLRFPVEGAGAVDVNVAYCPERVLPGHVVRELVENDRIVGGLTEQCSQRAVALYRTFVKGDLLVTNARTAEMCKLTENSFRDVNIAFANELSIICDKLGINVWELIRLANRHPRVKILQPGAGVGGHCIAVDPWFIVDKTPAEARLIRTAREVNDGKPEWVLTKVEAALQARRAAGRDEAKVRIAVLGLAFKPNIDDLRESPALHIAEALARSTRAELRFVEPNVKTLPRTLASGQLVDLAQALAEADIVVVLVAHREFAQLAAQLGPHQAVVDAVGVLA